MPASPLQSASKLDLSDEEIRGETIYFAVLDRFNIGRKDNLGKDFTLNDAGHTDWQKYWGGDIQGVINKLDYLSDLGVTALWLTPLFEQEREQKPLPFSRIQASVPQPTQAL